jgi:hypothetical protein
VGEEETTTDDDDDDDNNINNNKIHVIHLKPKIQDTIIHNYFMSIII